MAGPGSALGPDGWAQELQPCVLKRDPDLTDDARDRFPLDGGVALTRLEQPGE